LFWEIPIGGYKIMNKKIIGFIVCLFFLMASIGSNVFGNESTNRITTIYVDDDNTGGPWDGTQINPYRFIQDGIDDANPLDIVFVYNGTYYENVVITKKINLIGEDKNNTIIDGKRNGSVVYIIGVGVILSGFTLQNSSREYYTHAGIEMYSDRNYIGGNIIKDNRVGIHLLFARGLIPKGNNTVINNFLIENEMDAFCIHCSNNLIKKNHIENNGGGVFLQQFARFNRIEENNIINNTFDAGHFRAIFNSWDKNYWENWIGHKNPLLKWCPKMIPKYIPFMGTFKKLSWPSFDFHPQSEPYNYCLI
jgi:hypothetical protein